MKISFVSTTVCAENEFRHFKKDLEKELNKYTQNQPTDSLVNRRIY